MGMMTESQIIRVQMKTLEATEATNVLLTELLVEVRHANELTRWQIENAKAKVTA